MIPMKNLIIKYKSQLYYMLFGMITTVIDVGIYQLCFLSFGIPNVLSNVISWFISVAFSFITNKIWVYGSRSMKIKTLIREGFAYYTGRGVSLIAGTAIMVVGVDFMGLNSWLMKIVSDIFVVIINYGFGFFVFKRLEENMKDM